MTEQYMIIDHAILRTNQAIIVILLLAAFITNQPALVALVSAVMLAGTLFKRPGFGFIYTRVLKPTGLLNPEPLPDHPEPHRFAQGFGGLVAGISAALLFWGAGLAGWALTWLVIGLAVLNLTLGFCAGCAVYYWLNRLKVPGFQRQPPEGAFPGMRPRRI